MAMLIQLFTDTNRPFVECVDVRQFSVLSTQVRIPAIKHVNDDAVSDTMQEVRARTLLNRPASLDASIPGFPLLMATALRSEGLLLCQLGDNDGSTALCLTQDQVAHPTETAGHTEWILHTSE